MCVSHLLLPTSPLTSTSNLHRCSMPLRQPLLNLLHCHHHLLFPATLPLRPYWLDWWSLLLLQIPFGSSLVMSMSQELGRHSTIMSLLVAQRMPRQQYWRHFPIPLALIILTSATPSFCKLPWITLLIHPLLGGPVALVLPRHSWMPIIHQPRPTNKFNLQKYPCTISFILYPKCPL
ncbi:hypothetical protein BOTBODRAFT_511763 [Botryobasidium botryosum FD-172 SS1]|uniref:Uncharacterized protein n=1 Tax=Botryobasidium botryosum (strain FD-172 SS1) TaxID=930990 RepID=A0A067N3V3_BOTB1|nr:hypothetical protein BOTBODRAFT_511763 [Botryobasidium botryosum FD-172 SS1]